MGVFLFLVPYLIFTKRFNSIVYISISLIVSLIWMLFANDLYKYEGYNINILGLNSYPLIAWTLGLFGMYILFKQHEPSKKFIKNLVLFSISYTIVLLFLETVAYHIFEIRNAATAGYPGLPLCNCLHAPPWMQISYIMMGPIYFLICELVRNRSSIPLIVKKIFNSFKR